MPDEMQIRTPPSGTVAQAPPSATWLRRNEKFIRTLCMLAAYVFGAIFLISVLAVGLFAFVTGALAGIFVVSVAVIFVLSRFKRRRS